MKNIVLGLILLASFVFANNELGELYVKCEANDVNACLELSKKAMAENKVNPNSGYVTAAALGHTRLCELGDSKECILAGAAWVGLGIDDGGIKFFKKACDAGNFEGCHSLALVYYNYKKDSKKAFEYYTKACDNNYFKSCNNLGFLYVTGEGVKKDYAKAVKLYEKACNSKNSGACQNLGMMYVEGAGVKRDLTKGYAYVRRACDVGDWMACGNFALYQETLGDKKLAVQYYKKACELGKNDLNTNIFENEKTNRQKFCDKYDILK